MYLNGGSKAEVIQTELCGYLKEIVYCALPKRSVWK